MRLAVNLLEEMEDKLNRTINEIKAIPGGEEAMKKHRETREQEKKAKELAKQNASRDQKKTQIPGF